MALTIVVVSVWICAPVFLYLSEKKPKAVKKDKLERVLSKIAFAPLAVFLIPIFLFGIVYSVYQSIANSMKKKSKPLLEKAFILTKKKQERKNVYFLEKENIVIKICEFDTYEISTDRGGVFTPIIENKLFSYDDRMKIDSIMREYKTCDYRDKDSFEPTGEIIRLIDKYFI